MKRTTRLHSDGLEGDCSGAPLDLPAVDVIAIHTLMHAFFIGLDHFDDEAVAALMAPAFLWQRDTEAVSDQQALRKLLAARSRDRVTRHLVTNIAIRSSLSLNTAAVYCDILVFAHDDARTGLPVVVAGPACVLSTRDELIRIEGRWRIAKKHAQNVFTVRHTI